MTQIGTGEYRYEVVRDFFKSPDGEPFGLISRVAADAQDRIYVFQRRNPPVVVFDRDGKYLGAWGSGEVTDPHGLKIVGDTVYTTDRSDSVAKGFTLDGKVTFQLGTPGRHSDTGEIKNWLAERAAGPFNHPTEMIRHPNGGPAHIAVRDAQGKLLARMESRHVHGVGVDSKGDIYAGLTQDRSVDKFIRVR